MTKITLNTPRAFEKLLPPSRYKGAKGGRGSGKSHFFAELGIERCLLKAGSRGVCIREVQKSLKESAKRLLEDKINAMGVAKHFDVQSSEIKTPGGGVILFQGMQDHTAESIKSLEGFDWAWIEEAQTLSARSLELLRPTIREEGSEIWASWNPRHPTDAIDEFFASNPKNAVCVKVNYDDNPYFPNVLEDERLQDQKTNPHRYRHIWLGDYEPAAIGAIWDRATINQYRIDDRPELERILVSVDPAVSNTEHSDDHGIIVGGMGPDQRGYVLEDCSRSGTPMDWARRAIAAYHEHNADAIVIEVNQGGDMVKQTLNSVQPGLPIIEVRATRGKHVRAEPISSLYQQGRISHVGSFPKLENEMCQMTTDGYQGQGSPDHVDAMVWLFTELFPSIITPQAKAWKPPAQEYGGWMG